MGFTVVEMLVTLAVFGVGLVAITTLFTSIQLSQRNALYLGIATHAARTQLEQIRSSGFSTVNDGDTFTTSLPSTLPPNSTGVIHVTVPTNAPKSKQIDVTVTYWLGGVQKSVTISGYADPPEVNL